MPKSQERCQEIREETRNLIIRKSILFFARNGFAGTKISDLSKHIGIALFTQRLLEGEADQTFYKTTEKIIKQGQKEGTVVSGNARKLSEFYWGVVYLYAVKSLYTDDCAMINSADLSRILLEG